MTQNFQTLSHSQSAKDTQTTTSCNQHSLAQGLTFLDFKMGFLLTHPANSVDLIIKENQVNDTYSKTWKNFPLLFPLLRPGWKFPSQL